MILSMHDGAFDTSAIDHFLKPRAYSEGGVELLTGAKVDLLKRVMRALVEGDRSVLDEIGAYDNGSDPYVLTRNYSDLGDVHFLTPPGEVAAWPVHVMQVDD